jgi:hypothetical protein
MKNQAKLQTLLALADRVAYVVTDLNGLSSSIVNEEVTLSDFDNDLKELLAKLAEAERVVSELSDVFYKEGDHAVPMG